MEVNLLWVSTVFSSPSYDHQKDGKEPEFEQSFHWSRASSRQLWELQLLIWLPLTWADASSVTFLPNVREWWVIRCKAWKLQGFLQTLNLRMVPGCLRLAICEHSWHEFRVDSAQRSFSFLPGRTQFLPSSLSNASHSLLVVTFVISMRVLCELFVLECSVITGRDWRNKLTKKWLYPFSF